ncbi:MAG: helix-turn-helix domain-containing protein [Clostridiales Family XIII bacterium]|jgi:transcriptional regulator with XRE-family HTH domain|nr:helix-turn-helix domain-containing protein [Clostridiales Family XIII bacterium]
MSIDYNEIGKRIARRRRVLDLTQAELAERANLSTTYTGNVERGAKCSIETLMKLCSALDVTPDYILMGIDKEYRNDSLDEIRDLIHRSDKRKRQFIIEFIKWYANQAQE